jgi:hypothetical protein
MMRHLLLCALAIVVLSVIATPAALADNGCGYGWDYGYGWMYNSLRYEVPHFAAYPPVYYSYPVPRSYGYSPFAYPPHVMTPEVEAKTTALEIVNPYVPQQKPAAAQIDRAASTPAQPQPLVVINPFVAPARAVAQQ